MAHTRETDSEINSGEVNFMENAAEMFEKIVMMMSKIETLKKMMTDQHEKIDRKLTDNQKEIKKEMNEVKTSLDKIEKITDRMEKNEDAIQEIKTLKTENKEIKDKIEDINRNNIMEEASRSVYIHNVDVLIGMHEPRKHIRRRCNHSQGLGSNQCNLHRKQCTGSKTDQRCPGQSKK